MTQGREDLILVQIENLANEMRGQHTRTRDDIHLLRSEIKEGREFASMTRLLVERVVTERAVEEKQAIKRGTWAGVLAAFGLTAAWEGFKHLSGWKP